jgi:hypothetical protein
LHAITLPRADKFSSSFVILTPSGKYLDIYSYSSSVIDVGTKRPFLLPAVILPTILVPDIEDEMIGTLP